MTYIPITCYTQNPSSSSVSQNILLANAWESRNIYGFLEINGPSFHMLTKHMCIKIDTKIPILYMVKVVQGEVSKRPGNVFYS